MPSTKASSSNVVAKGHCHWIDWTSSVTRTIPDPTRLFSLLVIGIMLLKNYLAHQDLELIVMGFVLNPYVLAFFALAVATLYKATKTTTTTTKATTASTPLPVYDLWAAEWYWWNAWLYHAVMDGGSGTFGLVPVVVQQYQVLDGRFTNHHVVPWTIGAIELFIMAPLSLACCYCIHTRNPLRFPLEIVTSTFHFMGMVLFVVAEVYEGQLNVPALDPVGIPGDRWANLTFDVYHLTYYWFGFWFCNLIWAAVPYYRVVRAVQECADAIATKEKAE